METEQITNTEVIPQEKDVKQKDPRKVAAGKALARKNAEARKNKKVEDEMPQVNISTVYNGIIAAAALAGAVITLYHGYTFANKFYNNSEFKQEVVTTQNEPIPKVDVPKTSTMITIMD